MRKALLPLLLIASYVRSIFVRPHKGNVFLIFQSINLGGGRTYFFQISRFLLDQGKEIHLLVRREEMKDDLVSYCTQNKIKLIMYDGQMAHHSWYDAYFTWGFFRFMYSYVKQIHFLLELWLSIKPGMTVISQGWPFMFFKALYLPGRKYMVQHVMPLHYFDRGNDFCLRLGLRFSRTRFIAVSGFAAEKMNQFWLRDRAKLHIIHNFFEKKERGIARIETKEITITALARVEEGKNPMRWIMLAFDLLEKYSHLKFIWAGEGDLLAKAREATASEDRIQFIGFVNDVDRIYQNTDIYFEPSKREAHGISVVGAMAWGIPAIATTNGGTTESVVDGISGFLVDVEEDHMMLDRLERLISDRGLRASMGNAAVERYNAMFTRETWVLNMTRLFKCEDSDQ